MEDIGQLKKGLKIKINNQPCLVTDFSFHKPGKGQAVYRCKLKNLITQNSFDKTWKSGDKFEKAELVEQVVNFSYIDSKDYIFIDQETFEQISIDEKILGNNRHYLDDDMECTLLLFENQIIDIALPNFVIKKIDYTEPGFKGNSTSGNVTKPAKLDNGLEIHVPLFINNGDYIKIDTRTGKYCERINKKKE